MHPSCSHRWMKAWPDFIPHFCPVVEMIKNHGAGSAEDLRYVEAGELSPLCYWFCMLPYDCFYIKWSRVAEATLAIHWATCPVYCQIVVFQLRLLLRTLRNILQTTLEILYEVKVVQYNGSCIIGSQFSLLKRQIWKLPENFIVIIAPVVRNYQDNRNISTENKFYLRIQNQSRAKPIY